MLFLYWISAPHFDKFFEVYVCRTKEGEVRQSADPAQVSVRTGNASMFSWICTNLPKTEGHIIASAISQRTEVYLSRIYLHGIPLPYGFTVSSVH